MRSDADGFFHAKYPATRRVSDDGATVGEALDAVFESIPRARGYVWDDRGAIRRHMGIFVDGVGVSERKGLSNPIRAGSEIYVMQALSGGSG